MNKNIIIIVFGIFILGISFYFKFNLLSEISEDFIRGCNISTLQTLEVKEITPKIDEANQKKVENKINGKWALCQSIYKEWNTNKTIQKEITICYNVCKTITFFPDGTGIIETPDKKKTSFTFSRNDTNINIFFESKVDTERFFNNTVFEYIIEEKGNLENLILIHEDHRWILGREKQ